MHPAIKMTRQNKIECIEGLLEQLVLDTVAATLSNLIDRNKGLQNGTTTKTCRISTCPYSNDIQF